MKKVIFENCSRAFLATFCFLVLGVIGANAQTKLTEVPLVPGVSNPPATSSPLYSVPTGSFQNGTVAITTVDGKLLQLKAILELALTQGDATTFEATMVPYRFYERININLHAGATTANAIAAGMWIFLESAQYAAIPQSTQQQLKTEAINLLH